MAATQFILADNQDITRAGLSVLIAQTFKESASVEPVSDRSELERALTNRDRLCDSVVILDYSLFDFDDIEDLLNMMQHHPATHWILCSNDFDDALVHRAGRESAVSMILKSSSGSEVCSALKCATRHERYICHQVANLLITCAQNHTEQRGVLSPVETEILRLIAMGKTVKEIAAARNSSVHTIITHKKNIFRKIEVHNTYEATHYALRTGLIVLDYYI
jgi:DNA-binding NarL/FixJ family response regulator